MTGRSTPDERVVPPSTVDKQSGSMSTLQQPPRSSSASLGWTRRNAKDKQLIKRPAVIGESRGLSWGPLDPVLGARNHPSVVRKTQAAMRPAEVVDGAHQPHPRLKRRLLRHRPTPSHHRSQPGAKDGLSDHHSHQQPRAGLPPVPPLVNPDFPGYNHEQIGNATNILARTSGGSRSHSAAPRQSLSAGHTRVRSL